MFETSSSGLETASDTRQLSFWEQVKEDWRVHGKDWTKPGFRAVFVHRFGVWRMGIRPKVFRVLCTLLYNALYRKVRNGYGIELPYTVKLGRRVIIEHQSGIVVHGYAEIGHDSIIRQGVTIGNRSLNEPLSAPRLGHHVNVGAGAKILGPIRIGNYVNIGANAVVIKDIPDGATVVGIPAKIIKMNPEIAQSQGDVVPPFDAPQDAPE